MSGNGIKYVNEVFETNWIAPLGSNVNCFERNLAKYLGVEHCAALVSRSSAIYLAFIMLGAGGGEEEVCQSLTFSASASTIVYQGETPVFVDSEPEAWNMAPTRLR
mgnify:FL=1